MGTPLPTNHRNFDASVYTQIRKVELAGLNIHATGLLRPAIIATAILVAISLLVAVGASPFRHARSRR